MPLYQLAYKSQITPDICRLNQLRFCSNGGCITAAFPKFEFGENIPVNNDTFIGQNWSLGIPKVEKHLGMMAMFNWICKDMELSNGK